MNTAQLVTLMRTAWWKLAIGVVVGAVVALVLLAVLPARYEATSRVLVQVAEPAPPQEGQAATPLPEAAQVEQMIPAYIALATSDASAESTISRAGTDLDAEALRDALVYAPASEGPVVEVTASAGSPEDAVALADAGAQTLADGVTNGRPFGVQLTPSVLEAAVAPTAPASPDRLVVFPACIIGGFVLALCWVLLAASRRTGGGR
ncbi:YveK family protein [Brachybacterium huguangmaarense]